jgi:hypothetical protein
VSAGRANADDIRRMVDAHARYVLATSGLKSASARHRGVSGGPSSVVVL